MITMIRANLVTLVAGLVAVALAGLVRFVLPYEQDITTLWGFLVKLTPQLAAIVAIAWLDVETARRLRLHLVVLPALFLGFLLYFVPGTFIAAMDIEEGLTTFEELYLHVVVFVPFLIVALLLAYRLGGGSREGVLRTGLAMSILHVSGLEDLVAVLMNRSLETIPEVWAWADHITVRLGHPATRTEVYVFITVHVVAALLVLFVPRRWLRRSPQTD
ncbi:hypothetical protein ACBI99_07165 [Nonomuraea sp. ATR24]|uniref:hypothetical protein n=1 Tax=Nonomuraea TaxID=83681 RepID=UPI001C5DF6E8|nr:hypothetical protein [Nonomuraea ceibae]